MMRLLAVALLAFCACAAAEPQPEAAPNPYLATVVGTSLELKAPVPEHIPLKIRRLPLEQGRVIPDVLHYGARLDYSYAKQKGPAPLIFVIAGTGAAHDSELTQFLMHAFYAAGFHVVGVTSPTYPTFIIAASSTRVPGEQRHDAQDLYAVMEKIWSEIGPDVPATTFYLTGYSIGATNAAFVSLLDEERKTFNFEKVLLLDPSVQIYNSISKLDRFIENIPGGVENFDVVFQKLVARIGAKYRRSTTVTFSPELVYAAVRDDPPTNEELIALIGVSFRLASSALIFTSDVMTNSGFIKPANEILTPNTNLDEYMQVSLRVGLTDYFHEYMWPYFEATKMTTALTRDAVRRAAELDVDPELPCVGAEDRRSEQPRRRHPRTRRNQIPDRHVRYSREDLSHRRPPRQSRAARGGRLHGAVLQALIGSSRREQRVC